MKIIIIIIIKIVGVVQYLTLFPHTFWTWDLGSSLRHGSTGVEFARSP